MLNDRWFTTKKKNVYVNPVRKMKKETQKIQIDSRKKIKYRVNHQNTIKIYIINIIFHENQEIICQTEH